ncbi:hypothetical protein [Parapedobacter lycopersici]|uniref:hypothetical protein n=1 Tax=Parapedobacter lycopersici TaxID=1864939 RepID=UPI00333F1E47
MNRISLVYNGKLRKFSAPSAWNELSRKQLYYWCGIIRMRIPVEQAMQAAVMFFYGISIGLLSRLNTSAAYDAQLRLSLDFLMGENTLTKNVIGSVRLFFRRYHGPSNRLANISVGEYRRTELYYQLYLKTGDQELLRLLAATLFRPAGKGGVEDIREPVNEIRINRRARLFRWLNPNWLHAILLYYEGCRGSIIKSHPKIFKPSKQAAEGNGLMDLEDQILAYSGDKLGNFKDTVAINLYVFLKHMTQRIEEYERLQRKGKL